jgi:hypothetical protein
MTIAPGTTVQAIMSGAIGTVVPSTVPCPPGYIAVEFRIGKLAVTASLPAAAFTVLDQTTAPGRIRPS